MNKIAYQTPFSKASLPMLFIAVLGMAILAFGGVFVEWKKAHSLRQDIQLLRDKNAWQEATAPLEAEAQIRRQKLAEIPTTNRHPSRLSSTDIPILQNYGLQLAEGLDWVFTEHRFEITQTREGHNILLLRVFYEGSANGFPGWLQNLHEGKFIAQLKHFHLQPIDESKVQFQATLQLPLS